MKSGVLGKAGRHGCAVVISLGILLTMGRSDTWAAVGQTPGKAYEYDRGSPAAVPQAATTMYLPLVSRYYDGRVPPFGVQFYSSPTGARLTYATDAGARWIRKPIAWSVVEPTNTTPDKYNWSFTDSWVIEATQEGVHLILTLRGQPSWAAIYPQGPVTNTADLLEYVGALVERYDGDGVDDAPGSPVVQHFELYNEPDRVDRWGHNGSGYAELLRTLRPVVKEANPQANLVFGGMALDWFEDQGGPFDRQFLDDALAACSGHDCFDVMNFHYFPGFRTGWEQYGADIIGKTNYVRQRLAEHGFQDMPVIVTETTWCSGADWGSDELQSRYVGKGYVRAMAAGLDVVIWYALDDGSDPCLPGLLTRVLELKPAYAAYQTMTAMLGRAHYQRALTPTVTGSDQLVGYVFQRGGRRMDVVWTEDDTPYDPDDDPVLPLTVSVASLRVLDKFGDETWVNDDDYGTADGRITIAVGGSPLYLEYYP